jgi:DNA-binding NarL/FixJ family response regulator
MQKTILIAEDHEISRIALRLSLTGSGSVAVVGEAKDGLEVIEQYEKLKPDIVLMDIKMPRLDGISATQQIKNKDPQSRIIMITSNDSDARMVEALKVGADAYCFKEVTQDELLKVVNNVSSGGIWLDPVVSRRILGSAGAVAAENPGLSLSPLNIRLSVPEETVLTLQSRSLDNQEIAENMKMTREQVILMMKGIIEKLINR